MNRRQDRTGGRDDPAGTPRWGDPRLDDHRSLWGLVAQEGQEELRASRDLVRLLMDKVWDRNAARCLIARIEASREWYERLIADASEIADPGPLRLQPCHLGLIFAEAWNRQIASRSPCQSRLRQEGHGMDLRCLADPARLARAFSNLLVEAFEAGEGPSALRVRWSSGHLRGRPALRMSLRAEGPAPAWPAAAGVLGQEPDPRPKDFGLSLAAARAILNRHGGRLRLRAHDGPGLEYIVVLPREPEPEPEPGDGAHPRPTADPEQPG